MSSDRGRFTALSSSVYPDARLVHRAITIVRQDTDHLFVRVLNGGDHGGEVEQLTLADANDCSPRFSPDGSTIVFARDKTYNRGGLAANWEDGGVICVIRSDGTGERQLTSDEQFAFAPRFSADGHSLTSDTVRSTSAGTISHWPEWAGSGTTSSCIVVADANVRSVCWRTMRIFPVRRVVVEDGWSFSNASVDSRDTFFIRDHVLRGPSESDAPNMPFRTTSPSRSTRTVNRRWPGMMHPDTAITPIAIKHAIREWMVDDRAGMDSLPRGTLFRWALERGRRVAASG